MSYTIRVQTSGAYFNPKLAEERQVKVQVQLVGSMFSGETGWHQLKDFDKKDFSKGNLETLAINDRRDVGKPTIIRIKLVNWKISKNKWLVDWIDVKSNGVTTYFPVYAFIDKDEEFLSGEACLSHKVSDFIVGGHRSREIIENKKFFQWLPKKVDYGYGGFPRNINAAKYDDLPKIFKRYTIREKEFVVSKFGAAMGATLGVINAKITNIQSLDDYHKFSSAMAPQDTPYLKDWDKDEVCGWHMLNGPHPLAFAQCKSLPHYFLVNDNDVANLLGGKTLLQEMNAGKLYIADFTDIYQRNSGLVWKKGAYCSPAVGLFHVNASSKFVPIAIQLQPSDRDYLFVADGSQKWLLAKMYFRCCVSNKHEWIMHFFYTHTCMEPYAVSMFRCMSVQHPVYKLLRPHLRTVTAINAEARTDLIPANSSIAHGLSIDAKSFVKTKFKTFSMDILDIPKQLKKQGLDPSKIPEYWYGHDILAVWKCISDYVAGILNVYYTAGDSDVKSDRELNDWVNECANEGMAWEDGNTKGVPNQFTSLQELINFCVIIIGTGSAQHAAVNFGQYENFRFPPSSPFIMNMPPHKNSEKIDLVRIMKSLPNGLQASATTAMVTSLSVFSNVEEYLGDFREKWFIDEAALKVQAKFKADLQVVRSTIEERNAKLERPYNHLNPTRIPNSVVI